MLPEESFKHKFCVNCVNVGRNAGDMNWQNWLCMAPEHVLPGRGLNPVSGGSIYQPVRAEEARNYTAISSPVCGIEGKNYKQRGFHKALALEEITRSEPGIKIKGKKITVEDLS